MLYAITLLIGKTGPNLDRWKNKLNRDIGKDATSDDQSALRDSNTLLSVLSFDLVQHRSGEQFMTANPGTPKLADAQNHLYTSYARSCAIRLRLFQLPRIQSPHGCLPVAIRTFKSSNLWRPYGSSNTQCQLAMKVEILTDRARGIKTSRMTWRIFSLNTPRSFSLTALSTLA